MTSPPTTSVYEVRPRNDHRSVNLIFDALPFGRPGYVEVNDCEGQGHTGSLPRRSAD